MSTPASPRSFLRLFVGMGAALALFALFPTAAHAATLYPTSPCHWQGYAGRSWVGAAGGNTSVATNWLTTNPTACGGGNASAAPGTADIATFDPDVPRIIATQSVRGCDHNATIDATWSVQGIDIQTGYIGTATINTIYGAVFQTFTTTNNP